MQLPEAVDLSNARSLRDAGVAALRGAAGGNWVVDASALRQFDSSLLSLLLEWQRAAKAAGVQVSLAQTSADVSSRLQRLAVAYGLNSLDGMLALPAHHP